MLSAMEPGVDLETLKSLPPGKVRAEARRLNVALTGCSNNDQWVQRLILHDKVAKQKFFNIKHEFGQRHSQSLDTVGRTLAQLFLKVKAALSDLDSATPLTLLGLDDGSSPLEQISARVQRLESVHCNVIVAGETNAGKSTFLNLLLGMDVLPISIFSCTAAICVLKYSETLSAEIVYRDGEVKGEEFESVEEANKWLEEHAAEKDEDKREAGLFTIDSINVHLPALVLKGGVTLVDTPGIGENEAMYNCTMDYVTRSSAAGYIYVIKTDNAGGVHDDRLLDFLTSILQHQDQEFDPSSAMFVCNRWDQVPADQKEGVRQNALSKLGDVWPKFHSRQAFFLSASEAAMHYGVNAHYVTEDFELVLKGLKEVFVKARHNAVSQHYRWLKHMLHQSSSSLQTAVHQCNQTDEQLQERFRVTRLKLAALKSRSEATTQRLRDTMELETQQLRQHMKGILKEDVVRDELCDWTQRPLPDDVPWILAAADCDVRIMKRVAEKVDEELLTRGHATHLQDTLRELVRKELRLVDEELESISQDLRDRQSVRSDASWSSSNSSCLSVEDEYDDEDGETALSLLRFYKERGGRGKLSSLKKLATTFEDASSSDTAGRAAAAAAAKKTVEQHVPKLRIKSMLKHITAIGQAWTRNRRKSSIAQDYPTYMWDRTAKLLNNVADNPQCLYQMALKYHHKHNLFIDDVDKSIPRYIASNQQLMQDLLENRRVYLSQHRRLVDTMERLEPVREMVRGFGSLYIRDVTADSVCFTLGATTDPRRQSVVVLAAAPRDSGLGRSVSMSLSFNAGSGSSGPGASVGAGVSSGGGGQRRKGVVDFAGLGRSTSGVGTAGSGASDSADGTSVGSSSGGGVGGTQRLLSVEGTAITPSRGSVRSHDGSGNNNNNSQEGGSAAFQRRGSFRSRHPSGGNNSQEGSSGTTPRSGSFRSRNPSGGNTSQEGRSSVTSETSQDGSVTSDDAAGASRKGSLDNSGSFGPQTFPGLWATYRGGRVVMGEEHQPVLGRSYIQPPGEDELITEIARLRCLQCDDLAPFLGMSRMEDLAVFLFLGDLRPARRYLARAFHQPSVTVPHVLLRVLSGLTYLHRQGRQGLVHMDLSLDTVMVDREGEVKLSGACLPRRAKLPPDGALVGADPFAVLSPEVLRGEVYIPEDDGYSFGLLAWEMCTGRAPYLPHRVDLSLEEFRDRLHPSSFLELGPNGVNALVLENNPALSAVVRGCVLPARGLRARLDTLRESVEAMRSDPLVQNLSAASRRKIFCNKTRRRGCETPSITVSADPVFA